MGRTSVAGMRSRGQTVRVRGMFGEWTASNLCCLRCRPRIATSYSVASGTDLIFDGSAGRSWACLRWVRALTRPPSPTRPPAAAYGGYAQEAKTSKRKPALLSFIAESFEMKRLVWPAGTDCSFMGPSSGANARRKSYRASGTTPNRSAAPIRMKHRAKQYFQA